MKQQEIEVKSGERFAFGANWAHFLEMLDDGRIQMAEDSLKNMLCVENLKGKTFLDAGSGSGLFSLAARRLGAKVHSFDFDPQSVACTAELRHRYFPEDLHWVVKEGSVLYQNYLNSLGAFDIVYSWGVLHHTGQMWKALGNVAPLVAPSGKLFVAIYNDQGGQSRRWFFVKHIYNRLPNILRMPYVFLVMFPRELKLLLFSCLKGSPNKFFENIIQYSETSLRGMSYWRDVVDWVGGYPFEVAKPDEIFNFFYGRGFSLARLKTCGGGLGCNEFVFYRN